MKTVVALSGGIDSTSLALMMPDAELVFTDTKWEHDELYTHLDRIEKVTGRKITRLVNAKWPGGLPQYIQEAHFFPNHGARYCTPRFKIEPMNAYLKPHLPATLCIGLRADEPEDQRVGNLTNLPNLTIAYPLREYGMTRIDCVRLCLEHDLLPVYPLWMKRGGCTGCFYKRRQEVEAMKHLAPALLDELQEVEEGAQDEREQPFFMFSNIGMTIRAFREQPPLFDQKQLYAQAADRSQMGAVCGLLCNR